jgi:hypothetical protein
MSKVRRLLPKYFLISVVESLNLIKSAGTDLYYSCNGIIMLKKHWFASSHFYVCFYLLLTTVLLACGQKSVEYNSPQCYNLGQPYIIKLPSELDEISGIAYYAKDNSIFAECDDKGCLYKILLNKPADIRKWKFSHKRDYEDLVLHDSIFYVLNNNGDIVSLSFLKDSLISHEYTFSDGGKHEFESLYYDDKINKLVLICKDCEADKNKTVSAYAFDLQQFLYSNAYAIDVEGISKSEGPVSTKYKPSAAAINPVTGELYILSSINKLLVIADLNHKVKETYNLDPKIFNQPEGIAFTANGSLFISNEAGNDHPATILFYQIQKSGNK